MWISFLVGYLWVRFGVIMQEITHTQVVVTEDTRLGSPTVIAGYHPHHIAAGVFLLAVAGWLALHYSGKRLTRVIAIFYGVGLGFIVDEVGFIVEGWGQTYGYHPEVFTLVVIISGIMMSSVYFPVFWSTHFPNAYRRLERTAVRLWLRIRQPSPQPAAATLSVMVPAGSDPIATTVADDPGEPRD